jgi:ABC-type multidrug transport system fused ATPase/permease subunit
MTLVILMVALLMIYPIMLILSFSVAVLSSLIIKNLHKKSELAGKKITQANKKLNFKFIEEISGLKTRRLSNSINHSISFIKKRLDEWSSSFLGLEKISVSIRPVIEFIGIVSLAIILLGFSYFLVDSNMFVDNSTALLTFMVIFSRILSPVSSINQSISGIKSNMPYVKITEEFLSELEVDKVVDGRIEKTKLEKSIEFKNVFFRYNKSTNDALTDVSFLIPLGSKVGIVGLSGSGKSSLVDLLLRHYDPYSGNILVDGIDLKDITLVSWYEILGVVNQDPFLFDSSISYNISFGQDSGNLQKTIKAAKKAHIHDFVQSLPDGYDSIVGGRGDLLSGGQRQRISIARALFHNPDVLIFDEATSALDSETELDIRLAIEELSTSKTIIMVAHRMSTILDSDIIIVMDKGKIIQYGNPDELIKQKDKKFYQLLKGQSNG